MRLFSELFTLLTTKHQKSRLQKPNSMEDRQQQDPPLTHTQINLNLRLGLDLLFPTKWDLERVICATCRGGTTYLDPWKVIGWKDWCGSDSRWTLLAAAGQQRRRVGRTVEGRAAIHACDPGHSPT